MQSRNVMEWIANYIKDQGYSVKELSFMLQLPEKKLTGEMDEELSAEEFLDLCSYLNIKPERIREEIKS
ncbi:MAG: hypothetical protein HFI81_00980 [Eubacterium sp.]|jgi:hypothetical protein|nr:hypothetical protein [Eubacterium sp.]